MSRTFFLPSTSVIRGSNRCYNVVYACPDCFQSLRLPSYVFFIYLFFNSRKKKVREIFFFEKIKIPPQLSQLPVLFRLLYILLLVFFFSSSSFTLHSFRPSQNPDPERTPLSLSAPSKSPPPPKPASAKNTGGGGGGNVKFSHNAGGAGDTPGGPAAPAHSPIAVVASVEQDVPVLRVSAVFLRGSKKVLHRRVVHELRHVRSPG